MNFPKPQLDQETAMKLWLEERSDYAKEQVILNNTGMVGIILKSLNLNSFDEDLFSIGLIGVVKAVNTFDPDKNVKFSTYATAIIRNEFFVIFRKKRIIPVISLDEPYNLGNGESIDFLEIITDDKSFEEKAIEDIQMKQIFSTLSEREKKIISLSMDGKRNCRNIRYVAATSIKDY